MRIVLIILVENSTMVSTSTGVPGGLPLEDSSTIRPDINASGADFLTQQGVPQLIVWSILCISSQGLDLMLTLWRDKTNPMVPHFL